MHESPRSDPPQGPRGFAAWLVDVPVCVACRTEIRDRFAWSCLRCDAALHETCVGAHRPACPRRTRRR